MSEITGIAWQKIHPGKLAEIKRLVAACMRVARTKDTGSGLFPVPQTPAQ